MCFSKKYLQYIFSMTLFEILVTMPRRSLVIVGGEARYQWNHAIHRIHISHLRMAMTLREMTPEFLAGGVRESNGTALIDIANTYEGTVVT